MFRVLLGLEIGSVVNVHLSVLNLYLVPMEAVISGGVHASSVWYTLVCAVQDSLPRVKLPWPSPGLAGLKGMAMSSLVMNECTFSPSQVIQ